MHRYAGGRTKIVFPARSGESTTSGRNSFVFSYPYGSDDLQYLKYGALPRETAGPVSRSVGGVTPSGLHSPTVTGITGIKCK